MFSLGPGSVLVLVPAQVSAGPPQVLFNFDKLWCSTGLQLLPLPLLLLLQLVQDLVPPLQLLFQWGQFPVGLFVLPLLPQDLVSASGLEDPLQLRLHLQALPGPFAGGEQLSVQLLVVLGLLHWVVEFTRLYDVIIVGLVVGSWDVVDADRRGLPVGALKVCVR